MNLKIALIGSWVALGIMSGVVGCVDEKAQQQTQTAINNTVEQAPPSTPTPVKDELDCKRRADHSNDDGPGDANAPLYWREGKKNEAYTWCVSEAAANEQVLTPALVESCMTVVQSIAPKKHIVCEPEDVYHEYYDFTFCLHQATFNDNKLTTAMMETCANNAVKANQ